MSTARAEITMRRHPAGVESCFFFVGETRSICGRMLLGPELIDPHRAEGGEAEPRIRYCRTCRDTYQAIGMRGEL